MPRRHLIFAFATHAWEKSGVPGHVYWLCFGKTLTWYSMGTQHSNPSNLPERYPRGFGEYEHIQDVDALFRGRWVGFALPSKDRKSSRQAHSAHYPLSSSWCEAIVSAWMRKTLVDVRVSERNPSHTFRVLSCCIPPAIPAYRMTLPSILSHSFPHYPNLSALLCLSTRLGHIHTDPRLFTGHYIWYFPAQTDLSNVVNVILTIQLSNVLRKRFC